MNPILAAAAMLSAKTRRRKRRCAACGNTQMVAEKELQKPAACSKCGKPLPPNKA